MLRLAVSLLGLVAVTGCEPYPPGAYGPAYGAYAAPAPYYGGEGYAPYYQPYAPVSEPTVIIGGERGYYRGERDDRGRERDDRRRDAPRSQGPDRNRQERSGPPTINLRSSPPPSPNPPPNPSRLPGSAPPERNTVPDGGRG